MRFVTFTIIPLVIGFIIGYTYAPNHKEVVNLIEEREKCLSLGGDFHYDDYPFMGSPRIKCSNPQSNIFFEIK